MIATDFASSMTVPSVKEAMQMRIANVAISPLSIARRIAQAIEQPYYVDVGSIVLQPAAQD
jgi:NADP-dependent 3-hydroxy acid dehydrogenase YdfG